MTNLRTDRQTEKSKNTSVFVSRNTNDRDVMLVKATGANDYIVRERTP